MFRDERRFFYAHFADMYKPIVKMLQNLYEKYFLLPILSFTINVCSNRFKSGIQK